MFSATLPREVLKLSENYLTNPERISVGSTTTPIAKIKQEVLDYTIKIENEVKALKDQKDPEPKEDDGFLKFVADSRNWAYAYIENVQAGIWNFKQKVGNHIEYFDEFGSVMETPLHPAMRDISSAYKELIKFIPDDYGKIE